MDNNNDGIADCSQLLNYAAYHSSWMCGVNKIYVCHSGATQCISKNQLSTHYNHGDKVGPCISCGVQNFSIVDDTGVFSETGDHQELELFPNPADDHIEIQTSQLPCRLSILDVSGKVVLQQVLSNQKNRVDTGSLADGIYFIKLENGTYCKTNNLIIIH